MTNKRDWLTALEEADAYKLSHVDMYPEGMEFLMSNWTFRGSRIEGVDHVVFFGLQAAIIDIQEFWDETFFDLPIEEVIARHRDTCATLFGPTAKVTEYHLRDLHALGYLPLEFRALPEGTEVPLRVPALIIENTIPGFGWTVNYIESRLSAALWQPSTTATLALQMRHMLDDFAYETSDTPEAVDFSMHDFSFRGQTSVESSAASGAGHLLVSCGTDTVPSLGWTRYFYGAAGFIGGSVPASEHSVICAGGQKGEKETFDRLLDKYPTGILSMVSDTWSLWEVLTRILPDLKSDILSRDGKLVIRPDSGNPADIICGDPNAPVGSPAHKGVVQLLWDEFGGTVNSKGYKVLDSHVGVIYGDGITFSISFDICTRLKAAGFDTTTPVFGVGSYRYQYQTRDTFGAAMKATWAQVDGVGHDLFKDPVTDDGTKRSAKGRLAVLDIDGELTLVNQATPEQEAKSVLKPVWRDGEFVNRQTFREIVQRVGVRHILPEE